MKTAAKEIMERTDYKERGIHKRLINGFIERLEKGVRDLRDNEWCCTLIMYENLLPHLPFVKNKYNCDWFNRQPAIKEFLKKAGGLTIREWSREDYSLILSLPK